MVDTIEKILRVFGNNSLFDEGVELIGSWCFHLYQKHLSARSFPLRTLDIDFLIPNPFLGKEHENFMGELKDLGFERDFRRDGSTYLWNADLKIEFIAPAKGRGAEDYIKVKKLGINAIPLRFVSLLLDNPITVVESGVKILLPNPANFCIHKLIIASRRRKIDKGLKDLQQAFCTSVIVDHQKLQKLFGSLPRKWRQAILRMLDKAGKELVLFREEVSVLSSTLQKAKSK